MPTGYNTFKLIETGFPSGVTVTVPVGSYNKNNLLTVLSSLLTTASLSMNSYTYVVSYSSPLAGDTYKYTFTISGAILANQPSIVMSSGNTSPFRQLGFESGTTYTFSSNILKSVNAINLSFILRAFVKSNMVIDSNDNILQEFLNYGSFPMLSVVTFQQVNYDMNSRKLNPAIVRSWEFSLVDTYDQLIDLNGIPWEITVVFYQRSSTHEVFKQELSITNEERLFRIEQQQKQIQDKVGTTTAPSTETAPTAETGAPTAAPFQLSDAKSNFPIEPFGITTSFLPNVYQGPV